MIRREMLRATQLWCCQVCGHADRRLNVIAESDEELLRNERRAKCSKCGSKGCRVRYIFDEWSRAPSPPGGETLSEYCKRMQEIWALQDARMAEQARGEGARYQAFLKSIEVPEIVGPLSEEQLWPFGRI